MKSIVTTNVLVTTSNETLGFKVQVKVRKNVSQMFKLMICKCNSCLHLFP